MNKKKLQEIINENLRRYVDPMEKRMFNTIKMSAANTELHEITKAKIGYNLNKEGFTFLCEPKLLNGKRPDLLLLDIPGGLIYEIMCSETDERCDQKDYLGIRIIKVKTHDEH